jgi:hypothetical protein
VNFWMRLLAVSATYTLDPAASRANPDGEPNWPPPEPATPAKQPLVHTSKTGVPVATPQPHILMNVPLPSNSWMRLFPVSAT